MKWFVLILIARPALPNLPVQRSSHAHIGVILQVVSDAEKIEEAGQKRVARAPAMAVSELRGERLTLDDGRRWW